MLLPPQQPDTIIVVVVIVIRYKAPKVIRNAFEGGKAQREAEEAIAQALINVSDDESASNRNNDDDKAAKSITLTVTNAVITAPAWIITLSLRWRKCSRASLQRQLTEQRQMQLRLNLQRF